MRHIGDKFALRARGLFEIQYVFFELATSFYVFLFEVSFTGHIAQNGDRVSCIRVDRERRDLTCMIRRSPSSVRNATSSPSARVPSFRAESSGLLKSVSDILATGSSSEWMPRITRPAAFTRVMLPF